MMGESVVPETRKIKAHSKPEDAHGKEDPLYQEKGLWSAALGGGLAWFVDLNVRYFLVEAGYARTQHYGVAAFGVLALLAALIALYGSLRYFREFRAREEKHPAAFVAATGAVLNGLFALLIGAMLLQHVLLDHGRG